MQKSKPFFIMLAISLFIMTGYANAFEIKKYDSDLYLMVKPDCQNQNGCGLSLSTRTGTPTQAFFYGNYYQSTSYRELKTANGRCLEVQSRCAGQDWCPVQIWTCNGRAEQAWQISYSESFPDRNGYVGAYAIRNRVNGKVLKARCAGFHPSTCILEVENYTHHQSQGWQVR